MLLHIIDKLSMDGVNPSSCAVLIGDWYASMDAYSLLSILPHQFLAVRLLSKYTDSAIAVKIEMIEVMDMVRSILGSNFSILESG